MKKILYFDILNIFAGVAGHTGYSSCLKCTTDGEYNHDFNVMTFPETNAALRTDAEFRSGIYEGHHKERTILESIHNLDLIKDFPIGDTLHLLDLGIMKRLLQGWKSGNLNNYNAKWSASQIQDISLFLKDCKFPREIHRSVRGLEDLPRWKGTECRNFLMYLSVVVIDKFFDDKIIYEHFLNFFCAVVILSRKDQCARNYNIARFLLNDFLAGIKILYGKHLFTSNMHNLCHLVDDVERFGPLYTFSAYPFESKLYYLKRLIRSGNLPLSQIANRISEMQSNVSELTISESLNNEIVLLRPIKDLEKLAEDFKEFFTSIKMQVYSFIRLKDYSVNTASKTDKWVMSKKYDIISIKYIVQLEECGSILFFGYPLKNLFDYFIKPVRSSELQIYASDLELCQLQSFDLANIFCKMIEINCKEQSPKSLFIPLIHTLI